MPCSYAPLQRALLSQLDGGRSGCRINTINTHAGRGGARQQHVPELPTMKSLPSVEWPGTEEGELPCYWTVPSECRGDANLSILLMCDVSTSNHLKFSAATVEKVRSEVSKRFGRWGSKPHRNEIQL